MIKLGPQLAYAIGLGPVVGRFVLLLTTIGRRSGRLRVTPLIYEKRGDLLYMASARGPSADWLHNLQANPTVYVQVGRRRFRGQASLVRDSQRAVGYLRWQLERAPRAFGVLMRAEGLSSQPSDDELEQLARRRPLVVIHSKPRNVAPRPAQVSSGDQDA